MRRRGAAAPAAPAAPPLAAVAPDVVARRQMPMGWFGGNAWPVNAVEGAGAESWYQLRNTLDMSTLGFNQIRARDWMTSKWMAAIDLEKAASTLDNLSFTGQPLRSGEPVTFSIRGLDPLAANRPTMAFLTLVYDSFVNIHEAGWDISY